MNHLCGLETEYAVTALDEKGEAIDRSFTLDRFMELATRKHPHLPDAAHSGVFLQNGARFYIDWGHHPEFSTPECTNPWDAVRYVRAGELILKDVAAQLAKEEAEVAEALVLRTNVDYSGTDATWGTHESYLCRYWHRGLPKQLIPHLVSRLIYTGAGGFNNLRPGGLQFTLSPRTWHLKRELSDESTNDRGIFHTKNEPLAGRGFHRLHVLCGESLCTDIGSWLKVGTTAVVVAMIDGGLSPGDEVELKAPLTAMRTFAGDPTCRDTAPLAGERGDRSALEIQRHYLRQAEENQHAEFMPPFTRAVCREWRAMLDRLEGAPASVATRLDWAIKYALYTDRARKRGIEWESLDLWTSVVGQLVAALGREPFMQREPPLLDRIVGRESRAYRLGRRLTRQLHDQGLSWDGLGGFLRFRHEMCEVDSRFGQLGERGIFDSLDRSGVLAHHVPGVYNIQQAVENPPSGGRAYVRGNQVRRLSGNGSRYLCDWRSVVDHGRRRRLDLSDPFDTSVVWRDMDADELEMFSFRPDPDEDSVLSRLRMTEERIRRRVRAREGRPF